MSRKTEALRVLNRERRQIRRTLDQAADELGTDRRVVKELIRCGRLKAYGPSSERYVRADELAQLKAYITERIEQDPDWLMRIAQRANVMAPGGRRKVVKAIAEPRPRVVTLADAPPVNLPRKVVRSHEHD